MIVTCPACRSRYRVDAADLARPGGRTVRCTACGHLWRYLSSEVETGPPASLAGSLEAPSRSEAALPPALPHRSPWLTVGLPIIVFVVVVAALAALYLSR